MQRSINFAKGLLVLSYTSLYLLIFIFASSYLQSFLSQAVFNIIFIAIVIATQDRFFAAFLQALGSFRVDSALRRIGGIAELIDNLHEYTELDDLLRYTQTSLSALMGGAGATIFVAQEVKDNPEGTSNFLLWSQHGMQKKSDMEKILHYSKKVQQSFSFEDSPGDIKPAFQIYNAQIALPIFFGRKMLALLLLRDPSNVYGELNELLAFFSRQLGVALERITSEQQKRLRKEIGFNEKTAALATLSATIAHEMRTPLSGVRASIGGVDSYLPELVAAYQFACEKDPERFPSIRAELLGTLAETGPRIKSMVDQANHVIDLLLANLSDQQTDQDSFKRFSVRSMIDKALEQYPFRRGEREKVSLLLTADFEVYAEESLMIYVLFNLLKNSLYSIESAGHGHITFKVETGKAVNKLIFEDTGLGIEREILPLIFGGFFTTRNNGTGAGLAFCRRTMRSIGGEITASSELGVYTRFVLEFPAANVKTS